MSITWFVWTEPDSDDQTDDTYCDYCGEKFLEGERVGDCEGNNIHMDCYEMALDELSELPDEPHG